MKTTETQGQVVPVTPIRKLLRKIPSLRRKRSRRTSSSQSVGEGDVRITPTWSEFPPTLRRHLSNDILDSHTSTTQAGTVPAPHCSNRLTQPKRAQLAIQQYDQVHDAIVVSTLPYYPFCCHEDLLAMTRPRLLQTAYLFNSCLPFSGRFTDLEVSSDAYIRHRIEELVGIVSGPTDDLHQRRDKDVKAISDSLEHCELDMATLTPPSSPLATYPSSRRMLSSPRCLEVLIEEDESDFSSCRRTLKRRKVDSSTNAELNEVSIDRRRWGGL